MTLHEVGELPPGMYLLRTLESAAWRGCRGSAEGLLEALCPLSEAPANGGQGETHWVWLCHSVTPFFCP